MLCTLLQCLLSCLKACVFAVDLGILLKADFGFVFQVVQPFLSGAVSVKLKPVYLSAHG